MLLINVTQRWIIKNWFVIVWLSVNFGNSLVDFLNWQKTHFRNFVEDKSTKDEIGVNCDLIRTCPNTS